MSSVSLLLHGLLILVLWNITANGSLIRLYCQNPNSELCKVHYRRNSFNRYSTVADHNSVPALANEEPLYIRALDEDIQKLRDQLEGKKVTTEIS